MKSKKKYIPPAVEKKKIIIPALIMNQTLGCKINLAKFRCPILVDHLVCKWTDDIQDGLPIIKDRIKNEASLDAGEDICVLALENFMSDLMTMTGLLP